MNSTLRHRVRVGVTDVILPLVASFGLGAALNPAPCPPEPKPEAPVLSSSVVNP